MRYPNSAPLYEPRVQPHPGVSTLEARIAHYMIAPKASSTIVAATALDEEDPVVITTVGAIDVPRTLDIVPDTSAIGAKVTIIGTDMAGNEITEIIAALVATTNVTANAFRSVKSIEVSAGAGTITVKTSNNIGLPAALRHNTVLDTLFDNASITGETGYAVAVSDTLAANQLTLPAATIAAFDGKKLLDVYLLVPTE